MAAQITTNLEISEKKLKEGLEAMSWFKCPYGIHCLFRAPLKALNCAHQEECAILYFRRIVEETSPLFFEKIIKLSNYSRAIQCCNGLRIEGGTEEQLQKIELFYRDLFIFGQMVVLAFWPLLIEKGEMPNFSIKEIREIDEEVKNISFVRKTLYEMKEINEGWLNTLASLSGELMQQKKYTLALFTLMLLFIKKNVV